MIAALPMYDFPWLRPAHDRLWSLLARRLRGRGLTDIPASLDRTADLEGVWTSPGLLLGQSCGYPLVTQLSGKVRLVATPHYRAEGCDGPFHRSAIVIRRDDPAHSLADLRGRRAGVNGHHSNTGMNLFRAAIAPVAEGPDFFGSVRVTGSHARSLAALIAGRIDVAAIDAVTLALLCDRYPDQAEALRILDWTGPSPALPIITARFTSDRVWTALSEELAAIGDDPAARESLAALRIERFAPAEAYDALLDLERRAADRGYPILR